MNNYRNVLFDPLVRFAESDRKKQNESALHHWFTRNRGVAARAWPVSYEPTYHYEKLQCPAGIDEKYWDTLSHADTFWSMQPVKDQSTIDPPYYWHEQFLPEHTVHVAPEAELELSPTSDGWLPLDHGSDSESADFNPTYTNLKSMEALSAVEQLAVEENLAQEKAMQDIKDEALEIADAGSKGSGSISALKKVIAFRKSRNQWQRAGNW